MITNQQLVINNLEEKLKVFTHAVSGELTQEEDFVIANTEIPTDTFNVVLPKSPNIKNAVKIKHGIDNFFDKKYPFSIWIDAQYLTEDWTKLMQEYDQKEAERNVMMKLENTLNVGQRISNQLIITNVKNNEELLKYRGVQMKLGSEVQMFIGCIDEMPVTTGLLIESKNSYGIYDVMTKEAFRGKGIGSEMFQFLLNQTKDKQKPVVLQASDDGKNIYKRFGFIDVGEMVVFE